MKKISIATLEDAKREALTDVRDMGVVHIEPVADPQSSQIEDLRSRIEMVRRALRALSSRKPAKAKDSALSGLHVARNVVSMLDDLQNHHERLGAVSKQMDQLRPLGDFSPSELDDIRENGLVVRLYKYPKKLLKRTSIPVPHQLVGEEGDQVFVLAVSDKEFDLSFSEVKPPAEGLRALESEAASIREKMAEIEQRLGEEASHRGALEQSLSSLEESFEFENALAGMGRDQPVSYLQGFCPVDEIEPLKKRGYETGWGLLIEEPGEGDDVPTLTRNPRWIQIIKPVFRFMGTVPGYHEFDISSWFLISLSLFFAMLVGDGGYGLIFLLATLAAKKRFKSAPPELFSLLYLFSGCTLLWGLITGTWFGVEYLSALPILNRLVVPRLYSFSDNQEFMIQLCFVLGAVHLTIAHVIRAYRLMGSSQVLSEIGWIAVLWALFFLAGHLVLRKTLPTHTFYLLLPGLLLAALFSNPQKNFIKSSLLGLADLPLNIIRSFSDLVSYLRLFAVGYATLVVAVSFNQMALELAGESFLRSFAAAAVVLFGHAMNIVMAIMAVLVHGIRLNMLEFSSHLGMGWSGTEYRPFKRHTQGG